MRNTEAQSATWRRLPLFALTMAMACACSDKKESTATPTSLQSSPLTSENADKPEVVKPDLAAVDVSFLVDPCLQSGDPAEGCHCIGKEAQTTIGPELLIKMSKAPGDDDANIQKYYTMLEMQKIMTWVRTAGVTCGLEEVN